MSKIVINFYGKWEDYDYNPFTRLRSYWQNTVLQLIRRILSHRDKKRVQYKLQAAYTNNGEEFYVNTPLQFTYVTEAKMKYIQGITRLKSKKNLECQKIVNI